MDTRNIYKKDVPQVIPQPPVFRRRIPLQFLATDVSDTKIYNVNFLFTEDLSEVLMIHKNRGPYPDTINGVGGKYECEKDFEWSNSTINNITHSSIREIQEETSVTSEIPLHFVLCEIFPQGNVTPWNANNITELWVFCGIVDKNEVSQTEDEILEWYKTDDIISSSVCDESIAGNGNVPYFVNLSVRLLQDKQSVI